MAPATVNPPIEYMNCPGSTDTGSWVVRYHQKVIFWNLENGLGEVETGRPIVETWLPAGLVENVIHLKICRVLKLLEIWKTDTLFLTKWWYLMLTISWYLSTTMSRPGAPLPWLTKDSRVELWKEGWTSNRPWIKCYLGKLSSSNPPCRGRSPLSSFSSLCNPWQQLLPPWWRS